MTVHLLAAAIRRAVDVGHRAKMDRRRVFGEYRRGSGTVRASRYSPAVPSDLSTPVVIRSEIGAQNIFAGFPAKAK